MQDYLGQELALDDLVVFVQKGYRNFKRGRITKMTAKTVFISFGDKEWDTIKQDPSQVIKIVEPVPLPA